MNLFELFGNALEGKVLDFSCLKEIHNQGFCNSWGELKDNAFKNPSSRIDSVLQNFLNENTLLKNLKDNVILTPIGWEYRDNTIILKMNDEYFPLNDERARYKIINPFLIGSSTLILDDELRSYSFNVLN